MCGFLKLVFSFRRKKIKAKTHWIDIQFKQMHRYSAIEIKYLIIKREERRRFSIHGYSHLLCD